MKPYLNTEKKITQWINLWSVVGGFPPVYWVRSPSLVGSNGLWVKTPLLIGWWSKSGWNLTRTITSATSARNEESGRKRRHDGYVCPPFRCFAKQKQPFEKNTRCENTAQPFALCVQRLPGHGHAEDDRTRWEKWMIFEEKGESESVGRKTDIRVRFVFLLHVNKNLARFCLFVTAMSGDANFQKRRM